MLQMLLATLRKKLYGLVMRSFLSAAWTQYGYSFLLFLIWIHHFLISYYEQLMKKLPLARSEKFFSFIDKGLKKVNSLFNP
jgi:hypothetical protein